MRLSFWSAACERRAGTVRRARTLFLLVIMVTTLVCRANAEQPQHFSRQWAVHIEGGVQVADAIASKHGFVSLGEIFPDWYHFEHHKVAKRSVGRSVEHHENLVREAQVKWARQQVVRSRQKRDPLPFRQRSYRVNLNDPRWPQMWYLNRGQGLDMNVQPAWQEGITGVGVVVTILDDGLEKDHPDLFRNYDPQASYDVNNHDEDPMPRYDLIDSNRHGTRCAGEVAATANNSLCAVGVAYGASVGGVRMLDGDVTDAVEARSLSLNPQHIDIYSASWGPDDDGKTVDGPGELATRAFIEGVTKGRSGKGSIFVWASGNGGRDHDNCNCDGYTNSIWTLSISSATENGYVPWYSEACSSTLATTYSSGASGEKQVVTTDLHHQCTSSHTGTSASAPLAAGICALALESNRELTWRDMQHIVVRTARPANLKSSDWKVNGVGRNVSHSFGYGLMDAYAMVKLARNWKTVPEQHKCEVSAPHIDKLIPAKSHVSLQLHVNECAGVNFLEHVQAKVSLVSARRGDLQIHLTSPAGTRATLLARRPHDVSRAGFQAWPFMSVHTWGEKPFGIWQLEIHNEGRFLGTLTDWKLVFYGTETAPEGDEHEGDDSNVQVTGSKVDLKPSEMLTNGEEDTDRNDVVPIKGGVWKEFHQVDSTDHARNEVQRTTTEDDMASASAGCRALSKKGQQCIECSKGLYLYEGRCEVSCPEPYFPSLNAKSQLVCSYCHYTCKACSGPNDYQCISCYGDASLKHTTKAESYCYPKAILPALETSKWFYWMFIAFCANVAVLTMIMIYFIMCKLLQNSGCCSKHQHYRKMSSGENLTDSLSKDRNSAVYDLSESDSDGS